MCVGVSVNSLSLCVHVCSTVIKEKTSITEHSTSFGTSIQGTCCNTQPQIGDIILLCDQANHPVYYTTIILYHTSLSSSTTHLCTVPATPPYLVVCTVSTDNM